MTAKAAAPKKPDSSLKTRVVGGLAFGAVFLGALYLGGIAFTLLMTAFAVIGVYEWVRMVSLGPQRRRRRFTVLGALYIGFSIGMMIWLRNLGLYHMLTLLLIVWASDVCAYFTGRAIGGPKLAPNISPKKTWAGFWGSSAGAAIVAGMLAFHYPAATLGHMGWKAYALMGFILAMFGQVGDLMISVVKRYYNVKDTGALIPGHGGILDRIDALMLVALIFGVMAIYLQ